MSKKPKKLPSFNAAKLTTALRQLGHTNVKVHWERLGGGTEMCGQSGGWFFVSDQQRGLMPLGSSIGTALHNVPRYPAAGVVATSP